MLVTPFAGGCGAEISGVNLRDCSNDVINAIMRAAATCGVLLFREKLLTEEEQLAFTRLFGESDISELTGMIEARMDAPELRSVHVGRSPDVVYFTDGPSYRDVGFSGDKVGFGCLHADLSYKAEPLQYTILSAIEAMQSGGETEFVDAAAALEDLPDSGSLAGLEALHARSVRGSSAVHSARHPVVVRNPNAAVDALYVNPSFTKEIAGAEPDLLGRLLAHLEEHPARYVHRWQPGDLVLWDNLRVVHRRCAFAPGENRVMRRTQGRRIKPSAPGDFR